MGNLKEEISSNININLKRVKIFIEHSHKYYIKGLIPKRTGGFREIYMPNSEIKLIQHFLAERFISKIPISNKATAYIKNRSIVDNAQPHIGNKYFLLIDISDFFGNIRVEKVKEILFDSFPELLEQDFNDFIKLTTFNGKFPQGAVTSPNISNIYMKKFDDQISEYVITNLSNGKYTRYSDDITISSDRFIDSSLLDNIKLELSNIGFNVNLLKTYFTSNIQKLEITGLKILSGNLTISNNKKRIIKNKIYHKLKFGNRSNENTNQILGYLYYIMHVDPLFFNKINLKYKKGNNSLISRLKKILESERMN